MSADKRKPQIGMIFKHAREECGLSIRELARSARVDATYISKLENRAIPTPSLSVLSRICAALPDSSNKSKLLIAILEQEIEKFDLDLEQLINKKHTLLLNQADEVAHDVMALCQLLNKNPDAIAARSLFTQILNDALHFLDDTSASSQPAPSKLRRSKKRRR